MNRVVARTLGLGLVLSLAGCYHATIETGRPAGSQVVENQWAHSFIAGLIPPSVVNVASQCPAGVARVETQHSILNMLAQFVTFNLYSPMTITVTCAAGSAMIPAGAEVLAVQEGATRAELAKTLTTAVERAQERDAAVYVTF